MKMGRLAEAIQEGTDGAQGRYRQVAGGKDNEIDGGREWGRLQVGRRGREDADPSPAEVLSGLR